MFKNPTLSSAVALPLSSVARTVFPSDGTLTRAQTLQRVRWLAQFLDNRFVIPGTRIRLGWDAVIGLAPGVGDLATTALAAYVVYLARELGAPRRLLTRMACNVAMDFVGGSVPVVGNLFDVAFRANLKNLRLLERFLQEGEDARKESLSDVFPQA